MFIHAASIEKHNHHNIFSRLIVCMFVVCVAYWCVSLCCSSDLPWRIKIAKPTEQSASALRPGISGQWRNCLFSICKIAPCIICAGTSPFAVGGNRVCVVCVRVRVRVCVCVCALTSIIFIFTDQTCLGLG